MPAGAGVPFPDYRAAFERATQHCREIRTLTAELALSGRAGRAKLRGRLLAGMAQPDSLRLEGVAPFGPPAFILVARPGQSVLLLPRDERVLSGAAPSAILEALAGVALEPDDLRTVVTGCLAPDLQPTGGRRYANGWIAIDLPEGAVAFLKPVDQAPRVVAGRLRGLSVEYSDFAAGLPRKIRIYSAGANPRNSVNADLAVAVSQLETNVPLGPETFSVQVPRDATPLSLEELRDAGPLGEGRKR